MLGEGKVILAGTLEKELTEPFLSDGGLQVLHAPSGIGAEQMGGPGRPIFGEPESKILYISFFGYYPILKSVIEKINKPVIEWLLKLTVFNAAAVVSYFILSFVFDISFDDFGKLGQYGAYIFLAAANIVFVIYDIGVSRVAGLYMYRLHSKIRKLLAKGS